MKLLLTAPSDQCWAVLRFSLPMAHVVYRVGDGPHPFRASILVSARGGLMVTDSTGFDGRDETRLFCQEMLRECVARGYDGILCGFKGHPLQALAQAVYILGELTKKRGWSFYVTEVHAPLSDSAVALIPSALSGDSPQQCPQGTVECFGAARVALVVERVAEDFFPPFPTGQGMPLAREEPCQWLEEWTPSMFSSSGLHAHYFTYMSRQNEAHFVLLDGTGSIRKKLQVVRNLDILSAVLAYPQVDDLLPEPSK